MEFWRPSWNLRMGAESRQNAVLSVTQCSSLPNASFLSCELISADSREFSPTFSKGILLRWTLWLTTKKQNIWLVKLGSRTDYFPPVHSARRAFSAWLPCLVPVGAVNQADLAPNSFHCASLRCTHFWLELLGHQLHCSRRLRDTLNCSRVQQKVVRFPSVPPKFCRDVGPFAENRRPRILLLSFPCLSQGCLNCACFFVFVVSFTGCHCQPGIKFLAQKTTFHTQIGSLLARLSLMMILSEGTSTGWLRLGSPYDCSFCLFLALLGRLFWCWIFCHIVLKAESLDHGSTGVSSLSCVPTPLPTNVWCSGCVTCAISLVVTFYTG